MWMTHAIQKQSPDAGAALTGSKGNIPAGKAYCEVMEMKQFQGKASHVLIREKH